MSNTKDLDKYVKILQNMKVMYSNPPNDNNFDDVVKALDLALTHIKYIDDISNVDLKKQVLELTSKLNEAEMLLEFIAKELSKTVYNITDEFVSHLSLLDKYRDKMKTEQLLTKGR